MYFFIDKLIIFLILIFIYTRNSIYYYALYKCPNINISQCLLNTSVPAFTYAYTEHVYVPGEIEESVR